MSNLIKRLKKRYTLTKNDWQSDKIFSKRYAFYRFNDTFFGRIHLKKISEHYFKKRSDFIMNYLNNTLSSVIEKYKSVDIEGKYPNDAPIWVFWWTGQETASPIVKKCIESIFKNSGNHPVNFIFKENYKEYIDIPEFIMNKCENKQMGLAHFADYIRVCLLEKYGGLWLDATIFCANTIPDEYFEMPFFTCKSEYKESRYISKYQWVTFCIGGYKGNIVYRFLKEAFEIYWKSNDKAIDYLFFDYIIFIAKENVPAIRKYMDAVPINTPHRDDLQAAMNKALPAEEFWNVIKEDTTIYKLSWRETYSEKTPDGKESVYGYFINDLYK